MRKSIFFICFVYTFINYGQSMIESVAIIKKTTTNTVRTKTPINLPFWDDFSITKDSPDSIRIWGTHLSSQWNYELSKNVYVNATLAINPPSYKVATFDGLDMNGAFHGNEKGFADQLVTDTINLQNKTNVVLSFYWQAGGNVEIPDRGDSLILQFHRLENGLSIWKTVWAKDGGILESDQNSVFTQQVVEINPIFLTQNFLFRFQSYGDLNGPLDAWHIDWIYLNDNRQNDDFFYEDQGFNGQLTSPFSPFKSLPIEQFKFNVNDLSSSSRIGTFNLENEPDNIGSSAEYILVLRERVSNKIIDSIIYTNQEVLAFNSNPFKMTGRHSLNLNGFNLDAIPQIDSAILEYELYFKSSDDAFLDRTPINLQINDTIRGEYLLHNFIAFDDGTAEYAAGTNISGGQIAVKFWVQQPDTLTHVDIYFPNINPPSQNSALELRIYKDLSSNPIYSQGISVINGSKINAFTRYKLSHLVIVSDTFYLGYQQSKNEYIGIGFDRSNQEATQYIFENKMGKWEQNTRLIGALMIRPIFSRSDPIITAVQKQKSTVVYPNPTKGIITIKGDYESISLMDFSGKLLIEEKANSNHDLSRLKSGLYSLIIHRKGNNHILKIIKK